MDDDIPEKIQYTVSVNENDISNGYANDVYKSSEKREIAKRLIKDSFDVYEKKISEGYELFFCNIKDINDFDSRFSALRTDLKPLGLAPFHRYQDGEHIIILLDVSSEKKKSIKKNIILLFATIFTTVWTGAMLWLGNVGGDDVSFFDSLRPFYLIRGAVYFSFPLMLILGGHELGHYFMAKKHGVDATLPFFIPVPPGIGFIGTFGAFITLKEPIPDRKALFDIGIAGPIAGFLIAIPVIIMEILLSDQSMAVPSDGRDVIIVGMPLMFQILLYLFPVAEDVYLHPMAFAGWVGLLVTAINLLPIGQLDGGHIARAVLGENTKKFSRVVFFILIFMGFVFYNGWLVFGLIVLFLGIQHPPPLNDIVLLDNKRKLMSVGVVLLMLLSFTPTPVKLGNAPLIDIDASVFIYGDDVIYNSTAMMTINVTSQSTNDENFTVFFLGSSKVQWSIGEVNQSLIPEGFNSSYNETTSRWQYFANITTGTISPGSSKLFYLNATPIENVPGESFSAKATVIHSEKELSNDTHSIRISSLRIFVLDEITPEITSGPGGINNFSINFHIENMLEENDSVSMNISLPSNATVSHENITFVYPENATIFAGESVNITVNISLEATLPLRFNVKIYVYSENDAASQDSRTLTVILLTNDSDK